jgi:hypothetical protein
VILPANEDDPLPTTVSVELPMELVMTAPLPPSLRDATLALKPARLSVPPPPTVRDVVKGRAEEDPRASIPDCTVVVPE